MSSTIACGRAPSPHARPRAAAIAFAQAREALLVDRVDHPKRRRIGGDAAEQVALVAQRAEV